MFWWNCRHREGGSYWIWKQGVKCLSVIVGGRLELLWGVEWAAAWLWEQIYNLFMLGTTQEEVQMKIGLWKYEDFVDQHHHHDDYFHI